uniref:Transmembrane protein n=1 Tax=Elaeophora elaphi TaxID=1147741 RepID=A0A158Q8J7_9BILA
MSINSRGIASSRYRDAINLISSAVSKRERHLWICSQIHSRIVFLIVQILMIILSVIILINKVSKPLSLDPGWRHFFIAYTLFFGAIAGIWALKLADNMHQKEHRIKKSYFIPPKLIIIPSYVVQVGFITWFAYETFRYLVTNMSSFMEQSPLFLFFGVLIPIGLMWLIILYIFAAEINCFVYVINHTSHQQLAQYQRSVLNTHALNNERHLFDSSSSRNHLLATDTLREYERTKSSESVATVNRNFGGSRKTCNYAETRIEVIPSIHATDNMASCFLECSRKGVSVTNSQLETVTEESSKSTNS